MKKYHKETDSGALGSGETVSVRENLNSKSQVPSTRAQVTAPDIYTGRQGEPGTLPGGMLLLQEAELLCSGRYHEL